MLKVSDYVEMANVLPHLAGTATRVVDHTTWYYAVKFPMSLLDVVVCWVFVCTAETEAHRN